jgi:hypothetical protein
LSFRMLFRGRHLSIEIHPDHVCCQLLAGEPLEVLLYDEPVTLTQPSPLTRPIPPLPNAVATALPPRRAAPSLRGATPDDADLTPVEVTA